MSARGWLCAGDPQLAPSSDPERSRRRLLELPDGAARRAEVLGALDLHAAALAARTTAPGHLTASGVVVDASRRRVLVLQHAKLRRWLQPGGHADGDHELAGVALKEASEETGIDGLAVLVPAIDLDVHEVDHGDDLGPHQHLDLRFLVAAPPGAVEHGNHESTALRWVTPEELSELSGDAQLVALARTALAVARSAPPPPAGWLE
jgi:8-oxo-dGTP pyrophosphatase MutT (NUDIX family)